MKQILFNEINLVNCDLFYCEWCKEFGKKSKMQYEDLSVKKIRPSSSSYDLTCTKCGQFLIRNGIVRTPRSGEQTEINKSKGAEGLTLKEVLNSFKQPDSAFLDQNNKEETSIQSSVVSKTSVDTHYSTLNSSEEMGDSLADESVSDSAPPNNSSLLEGGEHEVSTMSPADKIKSLLANNQISKSKLDEIMAESKRINNNLKLYFYHKRT